MTLATIVALGCLAAAPLAAQQPVASPRPEPARVSAAQQAAGPRVQAEFPRYQPTFGHHDAAVAAAANTTTITISTLGLVLIAVLLILLLT
jgi:hypothetical protein